MTITVYRVLQAFLGEPEVPRYGLELMKVTGLPSGTLYPILARLERAGWMRSEREPDPPGGRPARRYYLLTAPGVQQARLACAELYEQLRVARPSAPDTVEPKAQLS